MSSAGWYPDPSGQTGRFRYWDGASWGEALRDDPFGPPPPGATPPGPPPSVNPFDDPTRYPDSGPGAPPGPGSEPTAFTPSPPSEPQFQPAYQPYGSHPGGPPYQPPQQQGWPVAPQPPSSGGGRGTTIGLLLGAVVLVLALGVATFFVTRAITDDDGGGTDTSATDEPTPTEPTDDPSPTEQPTPTEPTEPTEDPTPTEQPTDESTEPTAQRCEGGDPQTGATGEVGRRLVAGGLSMPAVRGYDTALDQAAAFTFADGVVAPARRIEQTDDPRVGWVAVNALGSLPRANGFTSPQQAAESVMACMAASTTFYDFFDGRRDLGSQATTVDGADAWELTAEVRVDNPQLEVEGDVAKVVVVDTGDPAAYGVFVSVVPIGDQPLIRQQDALVGRLRLR